MAIVTLSIDTKGFEAAAGSAEKSGKRIERALKPIIREVEKLGAVFNKQVAIVEGFTGKIQTSLNGINTTVALEQIRNFQQSVRANKDLVLKHVAEMQAAFAGLAATLKTMPVVPRLPAGGGSARGAASAAVGATAAGAGAGTASLAGAEKSLQSIVGQAKQARGEFTRLGNEAALAAQRISTLRVNRDALDSFRALTQAENATALAAQKTATILDNTKALRIQRAAAIKANTAALNEALIAEHAIAGNLARNVAVRQTEKQVLAQVKAGTLDHVGALKKVRGELILASNAGGIFAKIQQTMAKASVLALGPLSGLAARTTALSSLYQALGGSTTVLIASLVGLVIAFVKSLKAARNYETQLVAVQKTTGNTDAEIDSLSDRFIGLANNIGISATELAEIGEVAGQLGIHAEDDLVAFADAIAKISRTSDLAATSAAKAFARILTVTNEPFANVQRLGAAVTALGNDFAASESEIAQTALEIAKLGGVVGLSSDDVAALGAAFAQLGVRVQNAGTASGRVLLAIRDAAREGGAGLQRLIEITDLTEQQIRSLAETDISEVFVPFLQGLSDLEKSGQDATAVLREFGLSGVREAKSLLPLITRVDEVKRAFDTASKAAEEGTATNDEFAVRARSLSAQLEKLGARLNVIGIALGNAILPAVSGVVTRISDAVSIFIEWRNVIVPVANALGALSKAAASLILPGITKETIELAGYKIEVTGVVAVIKQWTDALREYIFAQSQANATLEESAKRAKIASDAFKRSRELAEQLAIADIGPGDDSQLDNILADLAEFGPLAAESTEAAEAFAFVAEQGIKRLQELDPRFALPIDPKEIAKASEEIEGLAAGLSDLVDQRAALSTGGLVARSDLDSLQQATELTKDLEGAERGILAGKLRLAAANGDVRVAIDRLTEGRRAELTEVDELDRVVAALITRLREEEEAVNQLQTALTKLDDIRFQTALVGLTDLETALQENEREIKSLAASFQVLGVDVQAVLSDLQDATRDAFKAEFLQQFSDQLKDLQFETATAGMTDLQKAIAEGQKQFVDLAVQAGLSGRELIRVAETSAKAFRENFQAKTFAGAIQGIQSIIDKAKELTFTGPQAEREKALSDLQTQLDEGALSADQFSAAQKATNEAFNLQATGQLISELGGLSETFRQIEQRGKTFGTTLDEQANEKSDAVRQALESLINNGLDPTGKALDDSSQFTRDFGKAFDELKDQADNAVPSLDGVNRITQRLRESVEDAAPQIITPLTPLLKDAAAASNELKNIENKIDGLRQRAQEGIELKFNTETALRQIDELKKAAGTIGLPTAAGADVPQPAADVRSSTEPIRQIESASDAAANATDRLSDSTQRLSSELESVPRFGPDLEEVRRMKEFSEQQTGFDLDKQIQGAADAAANLAKQYASAFETARQEIEKLPLKKEIELNTQNVDTAKQNLDQLFQTLEQLPEETRLEINTDDLVREQPNLDNFERVFQTLKDGQPIQLKFDEHQREQIVRVFEEFQNFQTNAETPTTINVTPSEGLTKASDETKAIIQAVRELNEQSSATVNVLPGDSLTTTSQQVSAIGDALDKAKTPTTIVITPPENLEQVSGQLDKAAGGLDKLREETNIVVNASDAAEQLSTIQPSVDTINQLREPITVMITIPTEDVQEQVKAVNEILATLETSRSVDLSVVEAIEQAGVLDEALDQAIEQSRSVNVDISQGLQAAAQLSAALDAAVEKIRVANVQLNVSGSPTLPFSEYLGPRGFADKTIQAFTERASEKDITIPAKFPEFKSPPQIPFGTNFNQLPSVVPQIPFGTNFNAIPFGTNFNSARPETFIEDAFNAEQPRGGFITPPRARSVGSANDDAIDGNGKARIAFADQLNQGLVNIATRLGRVAAGLEQVEQNTRVTADNTADTADAANRTASGITGDAFISKTTKRQEQMVRSRTGRRNATIGG